MRRHISKLALAIVVMAANSYGQFTLISDDFSSDSSANYTVVSGGDAPGDFLEDDMMNPIPPVQFGYDYSTLLDFDDTTPIPAAPGTTDGSTLGVLIRANPTELNQPDANGTESHTVYHNTNIAGVTDYTMTVDMYLGIYDTNQADTTEHSTIGVAGNGVLSNHAYNPLTPSTGNYLFVSGDGQDSSDYRHQRFDANGGGGYAPVNQFDPDYLSSDNGTNVIGANFPFFGEISNFNAPFPGSVGDMWVTIKVEVLQSEGLLKYSVKGGVDALAGDPNLAAEFIQIIESPLFDTDGFVSFGLADLYSSVASDPENQFALFDNLLVDGSNPIGSIVDCDFDDDSVCDLTDIDLLTAAIASGMNDAAFDLDGDGSVTLADQAEWLVEAGNLNIGAPYLGADFDLDGNVDGIDFIIWNDNKFTANTAWSAGNANANSDVDGVDFVEWNNFKFQSSDAVAAVPEPCTGTLWALGSLLLLGFRRQ